MIIPEMETVHMAKILFFFHCNFNCPKFQQAKVEGGEKRVKSVTDGINIMMFCAVGLESII